MIKFSVVRTKYSRDIFKTEVCVIFKLQKWNAINYSYIWIDNKGTWISNGNTDF